MAMRRHTEPGKSGEPIRRAALDEADDLEEAVRNFTRAAYTTWPNEAGFDGLTEERGPISVPLSGKIPPWAAGVLYRTGPGIFKIEDTAVGTFYTTHWFDGLAHTHRFDMVPDGSGSTRVYYSSRRQSDAMMDYIRKHGQRKYYSFGQRQDPCLSLFSKIMSSWEAAMSTPEDRIIENVSVAVQTNLPGLDVAAGNLRSVSATEPAEPAGSFDGHAVSSGHRIALPKTVWITTDNMMYKQIDPLTLEPIGFATQRVLHPDLTGPLSCAHAQRDPVTGDIYNFNQELGRETAYRVFCVSASTGRTDIIATIRGPDIRPAYIHSLFLSPSFVTLCIPSSHIGMRGMKILWKRNIIDSIEPFDLSKKCKWFVVDRVHGRGVVAEFETDAGFFFHTVNSFEENDETDLQHGTTSLFCDVIEYRSLQIMSSLYYDVLLQRNQATENFWGNEQRARDSLAYLTRYHIRVPCAQLSGSVPPGVAHPSNQKTTSCPEAAVAHKLFSIPGPHCGELPTINPLFSTKRHRYVYSLPYRGRSTIMDSIVKTDTVTREALFWDNPAGHSPGEAIFVPRPGGTAEDDGVLLSVVLDGYNRTSYLLCLDAATMTELGRAEVGFAVALGFHGLHTPM
ncbi:carotenoid oxygenase [Diplogelasinospora grovesii]|uniref:Carotenoid oxygenase n=1 Tax=Diplogelasinospora grovesii TaxID=303347 RepID=A0AAN6MYK8_9PEZI|nr:carotenoid oxygenase [Diplogelasinospora grovesii]